MANKLDIKMDIPVDAELARMLNMDDRIDRFKLFDKALTAASGPVIRRARQLCWDGQKAAPGAPSGNSAKRSWYQRNGVEPPWAKWIKRGKTKRNKYGKVDWETQLKTTIGRVVRKYSRKGIAVIGPSWPKGNKAYFNAGKNGRDVWYWGDDQGFKKKAMRNFIVQAFDETKNEQQQLMKAQVKTLLDQMMKNL